MIELLIVALFIFLIAQFGNADLFGPFKKKKGKD